MILIDMEGTIAVNYRLSNVYLQYTSLLVEQQLHTDADLLGKKV